MCIKSISMLNKKNNAEDNNYYYSNGFFNGIKFQNCILILNIYNMNM